MKLVFKSKHVSVAILIGEDPVVDEVVEEYVAVGGSFEPAECAEDCEHKHEADVFGFSPVRA